MDHGDLINSRGIKGEINRRRDVLGLHRGAEFPSHDEPGIIIQDSGQIEPAPADDRSLFPASPAKLFRLGRFSLDDEPSVETNASYC